MPESDDGLEHMAQDRLFPLLDLRYLEIPIGQIAPGEIAQHLAGLRELVVADELGDTTLGL